MTNADSHDHGANFLRTNRLAAESSPYLLQHQHNPVDWHPWGEEAFAVARMQNKPIFLSVGYSTCYWCHVMERQCFENEAIAEVMNDLFINIKVDREERPDVDSLYMTAVQALTRQGGWPMSVFLTPDLRPFYGGTYFPPQDAYGRPGFPTLLRAIHDAWINRRDDVEKSGNQLVQILGTLANPASPKQPIRIDAAFIDERIKESTLDYDPVHGGFGGAPKFPRETLLELLLVHQRAHPDEKRMKMIRHTLDAMANGGIRDHLGGGFHRYSTDRQWLVPHFEIMLYDNAMLAWCYVEAYRQTGETRYARVARGVLDFILREMTSPQGAFYTAFDAEVDAQEGLNYLWTRSEIGEILHEAANDFCDVYGVSAGPNFADPHHGSGAPDKSIFYLPRGSDREDEPAMVAARAKLYEARQTRKKPLLDTKILTSWNALMIRAMAYAGQILNEQKYIDAAINAVQYLLKAHFRSPLPPGEGQGEGALPAETTNPMEESQARHTPSPQPSPGGRAGQSFFQSAGSLLRTSRDGAAKYAAFLDDYAFLAQGTLALHDATNDPQWRDRTVQIVNEMMRLFGEPRDPRNPTPETRDPTHPRPGGFFYTDSNASDLIVRQKIGTDSPMPSGNAVAASVLLQLGKVSDAQQTLATFAQSLASHGEAMSSMVQMAFEFVQIAGAFTVMPDAQPAANTPQDIAANVVIIQPHWNNPQTLELEIRIQDGFHLHAHAASSGYIQTDLFLHDETGASIHYPPGVMKTLPFADKPIRVYEGVIRITIAFAQSLVGRGAIPMVLRYQACDDQSCLAPVSKKFEILMQSV